MSLDTQKKDGQALRPKSAESSETPNTSDQLKGLVRIGLIKFWKQALPIEEGLITLLQQEAKQFLRGEDPSWSSVYDRMASLWPEGNGALGQLIADFKLDLPQAFLMALAGEVESSHLVNLTVAELQAPNKSTRPFLHLCTALVDSLFPAQIVNVLAIANSELIRTHILTLEGTGPMPLRSLSMHPSFWSILNGRQHCWPACYFILQKPFRLLPEKVVQVIPKLAELISRGDMQGIIVRGNPDSGRALVATQIAEELNLTALEVPIPVWEQHPVLGQACRYARWLPVLRPNLGPGEIWRPHMGSLPTPLVILLGFDGAVETADFFELEPGIPAEKQRRQLWLEKLGHKQLAKQIAASALLSGPAISKLATNARLLAERENKSVNRNHIAEARSSLGAERLRLLAQPVKRLVTKKAMVLPGMIEENLDDLILRSRRREALWQGLGATLKATPNPGVRALFVGESGTGKTLAASYIATELGAPLYRVDLSAVMNKYIGESEKNLAALLDQAAASDVVLLFDEADSLFGSRTEGKETGERYANMLTNFLLTRIENHTGLVLLTTNSRNRIDPAFTRRIDFIIEFPLPGYKERLALWHSHLGNRGPGDAVYRQLAGYCDLSGGQLRNVVIAAASKAQNRKINAQDLLKGLQSEYRKIGRSLPVKLERLGQL
jgi:hypothetical protein